MKSRNEEAWMLFISVFVIGFAGWIFGQISAAKNEESGYVQLLRENMVQGYTEGGITLEEAEDWERFVERRASYRDWDWMDGSQMEDFFVWEKSCNQMGSCSPLSCIWTHGGNRVITVIGVILSQPNGSRSRPTFVHYMWTKDGVMRLEKKYGVLMTGQNMVPIDSARAQETYTLLSSV